MENFEYSQPTNVLFGKNQILNLVDCLKPYGKRVLLVYGGESIKNNGLYQTIIELLKDFELLELGGIQPNPKLKSVYEGVQICKNNNIDVILGVGGGSAIDCAKAIAVGAKYNGDVWDLITQKKNIISVLPIVGILTISASGTEIGNGSVISNPEIKQKLGFDVPYMRLKSVILDPTYTMSVPKKHTVAGIVDIMSHLLEQYLIGEGTFLSNQLCEGVMKTVIHYVSIVLEEPNNYEARGQIMWASSLANNGILSLGSSLYAFSCHAIEHELSAFYDIVHGVGLAIVTPQWMRYILNEKTVDKVAHYGKEVWGINDKLDKYEIANQSIEYTEQWFKSLGVSTHLLEHIGVNDRLSSLNLSSKDFEIIAKNAVENGSLDYAWVPLNEEDVKNIIEMCL